jgi:hypothetical protein
VRPRNWLDTSLILAVVVLSANGCYATTKLADLQPSPTGVTERPPVPGSGVLSDGVQVTTDPNPHRSGVYEVPGWDSETTELAGTVTTVVIHAIVATQVVRVFGG